MLKKVRLEIRVIKSVLVQIVKVTKKNGSFITALKVMFGKEARYQINDGPWVYGSAYEFFKKLYSH